jgi:hypothetical protein
MDEEEFTLNWDVTDGYNKSVALVAGLMQMIAIIVIRTKLAIIMTIE